mgnify:CR=1 FL=1
MKHLRSARKATPWVLAVVAGIGRRSGPDAGSAPPDGRATMDKGALTRKLEGSEAKVTMKTLDGSGKVLSSRTLTMASKLYDGGATEKRIYRFVDPPDVKGTGILLRRAEGSARYATFLNTLLAHFDAVEEFAAPASGGVTKSADTWKFVGLAGGTAGWFRHVGNNADDGSVSTTLPRLDGSIAAGAGDLRLSSTAINVGVPVTVDVYSFQIPAK